jgi:hypothetical protein
MNWWAVATMLVFSPVFLSLVMGIFLHSATDLIRMMIGNGELILCSFLVVTSSIIRCYRSKAKSSDFYFISLFFLAIVKIVAYVTIRVSDAPIALIYISSIIFVLASIIVSWRHEKSLTRRR